MENINGFMGGSRRFCRGEGGGDLTFFVLFINRHQHISQRAVLTSFERHLDPEWGSVPVFLRKPKATCDFADGEGSGPPVPPLGPPMSVDNNCIKTSILSRASSDYLIISSLLLDKINGRLPVTHIS